MKNVKLNGPRVRRICPVGDEKVHDGKDWPKSQLVVAKGKCSFLCLSATIYDEKRCKMSGKSLTHLSGQVRYSLEIVICH